MRQHHKRGDDAPGIPQIERKDFDQAAKEVIKVGAMCFAPFFRRKVGDRYYKYGVFSLALMAALIPVSPAMVFFAPLWLLFLLAGGVNREAHSGWGGWTRLGFAGEKLGRFLEPFAVFALGATSAAFDEPFALFCFGGGACMFMVAAYEWQQINLYQRKLRDAEQEMGFMSRVRRGGW